MYTIPKQKGKDGVDIAKVKGIEPIIDENGDDEMVRKFKEKILNRQRDLEKEQDDNKNGIKHQNDDDNRVLDGTTSQSPNQDPRSEARLLLPQCSCESHFLPYRRWLRSFLLVLFGSSLERICPI
jgi:hypothetical protein